MPGYLYLAQGDITQLAADALAYSASNTLSKGGQLYPSFRRNVPGFVEQYEALQPPPAQPYAVGQSFWLPLSDERPPYGVALVVATGGDRTPEDKAALSVRAALDTAVPALRKLRGPSEHLLVALPAFRVGGGGDRNQQLRSARVQIEEALAGLGRHPGVDVAFVVYTPTLYHIFQEARCLVLGHPPEGDQPDRELVAALRAGECVLFAGAGLSRGAGLFDWNELIVRLQERLAIPEEERGRCDHLDVAQWYAEKFGPRALADVVHDAFGASTTRPTLAHYLLLGLPVRQVLTTNYDDLIERALTALKRDPIKVVTQEEVARTGRGEGVYVVKLHGDAADPREIILARDHYDEFFQRRPAMALLVEGLLLTQMFFFVGYGLRDPNFRQLYNRIARMLRAAKRPAFATTFEAAGVAGAYLADQWARKRLRLLPIPGASQAEQERQFLRFLDRLAAAVALPAPRAFLAPDVAAAPALTPLRGRLHEAGEVLNEACAGQFSEADVPALAAALRFLNDHGWRPRGYGRSLSQLWERLADHTADPTERRRLLLAGLRVAESYNDVESLRQRLAALDQPEPPPAPENPS